MIHIVFSKECSSYFSVFKIQNLFSKIMPQRMTAKCNFFKSTKWRVIKPLLLQRCYDINCKHHVLWHFVIPNVKQAIKKKKSVFGQEFYKVILQWKSEEENLRFQTLSAHGYKCLWKPAWLLKPEFLPSNNFCANFKNFRITLTFAN